MSDDEAESRAFSTGAAEDASGEPAPRPKLSSIPPPPLELSSEADAGWEPPELIEPGRSQPPPKPPNRGSSPASRRPSSPAFAAPSAAQVDDSPPAAATTALAEGATGTQRSPPAPGLISSRPAAPIASPALTRSSAPAVAPSSEPPAAGVARAAPPSQLLRPPPPISAPPPTIEVGDVEDVAIVDEPKRSVQPMRIISIGSKPQAPPRARVAPATVRRSSQPPPLDGNAQAEPVAGFTAPLAPQLRDVVALSAEVAAPTKVAATLLVSASAAIELEDVSDATEEELEISAEAEEFVPAPVIAPVRSKPPPPPRAKRVEVQEELDIEVSLSDEEESAKTVETGPVPPAAEIATSAAQQATVAEKVASVEAPATVAVAVATAAAAEEDEPAEPAEELAEPAEELAEHEEELVAADEKPVVAEQKLAAVVEVAQHKEEAAEAEDEVPPTQEIPSVEEISHPEAAAAPAQPIKSEAPPPKAEAKAPPQDVAGAEELDDGDISPDSDQFPVPALAAVPSVPPATQPASAVAAAQEATAAEPAIEPQKPQAETPPATEEKPKKLAPPPPPKRRRPPPPPSERLVAAALESAKFEATKKPRVRPWWEELFTEDFGRSFVGLTEGQIKREANFIEDSLGVAKGAVILDIGCGVGQHAVELSSRGYAVVGLDLSVLQLAIAGEHAQERGQKINFIQGDMREMGFEEMFDGIYCWNTTFGYFEEEKNIHVAEKIFRALRPGGSFLLDVVNRDFVVEQQPSSVWFEGDACVCMDDMSVDFITSRLRVKRTMMLDDGRTKEISYSIRIYGLHELGKLLHSIGFRVTEASGHRALPGVFMGATSPRIIILAQKPDNSG